VSERDPVIERIVRDLRTPERLDPALDARVMAAVRGEAPALARSRRGSPWAWLTRPRLISVSPLGGFALGGALAAILALTVAQSRTDSVPVEPATAAALTQEVTPAPPPMQTVQFVLMAPRANRVALVGDFNDWDMDATQLRRTAGDLWTVTIPLTAGRYTYTFVVDGERWVADPSAVSAPPNDFGRPSSVVTIGGAGS